MGLRGSVFGVGANEKGYSEFRVPFGLDLKVDSPSDGFEVGGCGFCDGSRRVLIWCCTNRLSCGNISYHYNILTMRGLFT